MRTSQHKSFGLATAAALICFGFMGSTIVTPLYTLYSSAFHFSETVLTLVYATYVVGNVVSVLFFGRLSDELGRRRVGLGALAVAAASALAFFFARGTAWLFVARLLSGLAVGAASGTGTAWLADMFEQSERKRATELATYANLIGAAIGPPIAGALAQYAPWPLRLPFILYLAILLALACAVLFARETAPSIQHQREVSIRPQIAVPKEIRAQFITPAITAFVIWGLGGFYFALLPSVLRHDMHQANVLVAGAVVFELGIAAIAAIAATRAASSERAMSFGLAVIIPSVALLVAAQATKSMSTLLIGSALAGIALGAGYRGSLQVVNEIAPEDRRAGVISAYFIACFIGNSVPVIGLGIITTLANALVAAITFAVTLTVFAVCAFLVRKRAPGRAIPAQSPSAGTTCDRATGRM